MHTGKLTENGRILARKAACYQLLTAFFLIALTGGLGHFEHLTAIAFGCLISVIPNSVFAMFAFKHAGASQSQLVAKSFSQGSRVKLALTIGLFVIAFVGFKTHPLPLFAAYAVTTASYWLALLRSNNKY